MPTVGLECLSPLFLLLCHVYGAVLDYLLQLAWCSGYSKLPTVIDTQGTYNRLVWALYPGLVPISGCWIPVYTYTGFQREGWGGRKTDGSSPSTLVMEQTLPGFLICVVPNSDRDKYPLRVYVASSRLIAGSEGSLVLVIL